MSTSPQHAPAARAEVGHIPGLDGVRAMAIVLVLCVHAYPFFGNTAGGNAVMHVLGYGWAGVDLFFVLSGMLITGILLDTKGARGYYTSFYARRSLRIFPLYYVALLLFLVVVPLTQAAVAHRVPQFFPQQGWLWTYTTNIGIARSESWPSVTTSLTFPYRPYVTKVLAACGAGLVLLFAISGGNGHDPPLIATVGFTLIALASAAFLVVVITATPGARIRRVLEWRWARHVGERSYGIYVWHVAVFALFGSYVLPSFVPLVRWSVVRGLIGMPIGFAAALVAANLSWVLLERPFLRLKRFAPRPGAGHGSADRGRLRHARV